ncbi:hypothetical protein [Microcoleus sp. B4-C3]|uniref:hypothetical protein n=1 Tax=Microcoleus sp. B4-C3 TaxID=2818662 RepID=UPI002FD17CEA
MLLERRSQFQLDSPPLKFSLPLKLSMSNSRDRASLIDRSFYFNNCFSRSTRCAIDYG